MIWVARRGAAVREDRTPVGKNLTPRWRALVTGSARRRGEAATPGKLRRDSRGSVRLAAKVALTSAPAWLGALDSQLSTGH
jgi:hypothetical protein